MISQVMHELVIIPIALHTTQCKTQSCLTCPPIALFISTQCTSDASVSLYSPLIIMGATKAWRACIIWKILLTRKNSLKTLDLDAAENQYIYRASIFSVQHAYQTHCNLHHTVQPWHASKRVLSSRMIFIKALKATSMLACDS